LKTEETLASVNFFGESGAKREQKKKTEEEGKIEILGEGHD